MRKEYIWGGAAAVVFAVVFGLQGFYPDRIGAVSDLLTVAMSGAAAFCAYLAIRRYGRAPRTRAGLVWGSFAVGTGLWFLAEVTWTVYNYGFGVAIPYPGVPDIFYLGGYVPMFLGFLFYVAYFRPSLSNKAMLAVATAILASSAAVVVLLLEPIIASGEDLAAMFFDLAYPLLDLLLLSVALLGLVLFVRGKLGRSWGFFTLGILLDVVADFLFSFQTLKGTYYTGGLPDYIFINMYLCIALALQLHRKEL